MNNLLKKLAIASLCLFCTVSFRVSAGIPTHWGIAISSPDSSIVLSPSQESVTIRSTLIPLVEFTGLVVIYEWKEVNNNGYVTFSSTDKDSTTITRNHAKEGICDVRVVVTVTDTTTTPHITQKDSAFVHVQTASTPPGFIQVIGVAWDSTLVHGILNGEAKMLSFQVLPTNATNPSCTFLSIRGIVKASQTASNTVELVVLDTGMDTIIIETVDGAFRDSLIVNVDSVFITLQKIQVNPMMIDITMSDTIQTITWKLSPANVSDKLVDITLEDSSVAQVTKTSDTTATFKPLKEGGPFMITFTHAKSGKTAVTIAKVTEDRYIHFKYDTLEVNEGDSLIGSTTYNTGREDLNLNITSSQTNIVEINSDTWYFRGAGTSLIKGILPMGGRGDSMIIIVKKVPLIDISLNTYSIKKSIVVGQSLKPDTLKVEFIPVNTSEKEISFKSDNESIAIVSTTGIISYPKPEKAGEVRITAYSTTNPLIKQVCHIQIDKPATELKLDKNKVTIAQGQAKFLLNVEITPPDATPVEIKWETSDPTNLPQDTIGNPALRASHNPLLKGEYLVKVRESNSGLFDTCIVEVIDPVGIEETGQFLSQMTIISASIREKNLTLSLALPEDSDGICSFTLYDMNGTSIWTGNLDLPVLNIQTVSLNINHSLPSGSYYLKVQNRNQTATTSLILGR
ncbi:hypothetical protein AGMMS50249_0040 [candidate division SR1 bacterium]|nr:hypothetical protein AGMMS50249_0040 [candidate division SR1 bacterium]